MIISTANYPTLFNGADSFEVGADEGWRDLITRTLDKIQWVCTKENGIWTASGIYEKFGVLRIHGGCPRVDNIYSAVIGDIICTAEWMSTRTCEICGTMDDLTERRVFKGVHKTTCKSHQTRIAWPEPGDRLFQNNC